MTAAWARILIIMLIAGLPIAVARAAGPEPTPETLTDPVLENRAVNLGRTIRCLVCQSQSIEDSNADLARDLRVIVRERILAGADDESIRTYLTDRYGDYVLFDPPLNWGTILLWFGPVPLLLLGGYVTWRHGMRKTKTVPDLTAQEQQELADITAQLESWRQRQQRPR